MSRLNLNEMSVVPNNPAAGKISLYAKNGKIYSLTNDGSISLMSEPANNIQVVIGDGTNVITTGVKAYRQIPYDFTLTAVRLLASVSGNIVVDIWKDVYSAFPPTDADSITSATPPTIPATNQKAEDTTLSGWTKTITAGDILAFNVDSCATITQLTIILVGKRT